MFLEEFHPTFHYIKGEDNRLADALSCLPTSSSRWQNDAQPKDPIDLYRQPNREYQTYSPFNTEASNASSIETLSSFYSMATNSQLLNCFLHLPVQDSLPFQLDFKSIAEAQAQDAELTELKQSKPQQ